MNHLPCSVRDPFVLELDFGPFNANFPHMTRPSSIGHGVEFLNRHLSSKLFQTADGVDPLFQFLRMHTYRGQVYILLVSKFKVQIIAKTVDAEGKFSSKQGLEHCRFETCYFSAAAF